MFTSFKTRSFETERMDDLSMEGTMLAQALDEINLVNRFLGGHQVVIAGLKEIFHSYKSPAKTNLKIVDLGCGGGDTLRAIADWAKKKSLFLQLYGIDANAFTINYACEHSQNHPNIAYFQQNIFADDCSFEGYDMVICSLFLHHFNEEELSYFLQKCKKEGVKTLLINDLQRHWLPYYLFKALTWGLRASPMTKADGLLSIRRGFTKAELQQLLKKNNIEAYQLKWKWAFRYQVICDF